MARSPVIDVGDNALGAQLQFENWVSEGNYPFRQACDILVLLNKLARLAGHPPWQDYCRGWLLAVTSSLVTRPMESINESKFSIAVTSRLAM